MINRVIRFFPIMMSFTLVACSLQSPVTPTPVGEEIHPCGDGICDGPENANNCPMDCEETSVDQPIDQQTVLYLGVMIHLEGWHDDKDQAKFEQHARLVREYASLFETYGARLTWESKEFTDGSIKWGDNVLLEMQERGHGVGVHADIGGQQDYDCTRFTPDLRAEKKQLESLGVTVLHLSGNTSHCDWVTASAEADYVFTTGQVAYSVMSMPEEMRPPEFKNCPTPVKCHDVFPTELEDRIHPWRMNSGADWTISSSGPLVMLAESGPAPENLADIDGFILDLEEALALVEPGKVNIYYVGKSIGSPFDTEVVEQWLQRVQPYVETGQVKWATLPEMYEAFVAWENNQ